MTQPTEQTHGYTVGYGSELPQLLHRCNRQPHAACLDSAVAPARFAVAEASGAGLEPSPSQIQGPLH